jgi:pimeloyl-ACP methyl ester carboxylesterase
MTVDGVTMLRHNRIDLALHHLAPPHDEARPLLILHGLGDHAPRTRPEWARSWTGLVAALDFTGHGDSTLPRGGGYSSELLMGDADCALAHLGPSTVVGFGLGAYVALLIAGGRPELVHGAVLADGPGLNGGATQPTSVAVTPPGFLPTEATCAPDPWALADLALELRPPDYATTFARLAVATSHLEEPLTVCAKSRAPWLDAVRAEPGVASSTDLAIAIEHYG